MKNTSLYDQVRNRDSLRKAWLKVRSNGRVSQSKDTRSEIRDFDIRSDNYLQNIARQLTENRFSFPPSKGLPINRGKDKRARPIVVSPVESRVVQRSILDVLQGYQPIKPYFDIPTSFGGIANKGVRSAIERIYEFIRGGNGRYFLKTDIKAFFTKIPKKQALSILGGVVEDQKFLKLFEDAISTELSNLEQLYQDRELFPIHEIGVAQGSCLSPLIGNIVLSEFDSEMNSEDVLCVRYIDDFIVLTPTYKALQAYLRKANKILKKLGMETYRPQDGSGKCQEGSTNEIVPFLGCEIRQARIIRPDLSSRKRLLKSLTQELNESKRYMNEPGKLVSKHLTLIETLSRCSNILRGWGNQYSFCNDPLLMSQIDDKVDELIRDYLGFYTNKKTQMTKVDSRNSRRLLGISLLSDCNSDPKIQDTD